MLNKRRSTTSKYVDLGPIVTFVKAVAVNNIHVLQTHAMLIHSQPMLKHQPIQPISLKLHTSRYWKAVVDVLCNLQRVVESCAYR